MDPGTTGACFACRSLHQAGRARAEGLGEGRLGCRTAAGTMKSGPWTRESWATKTSRSEHTSWRSLLGRASCIPFPCMRDARVFYRGRNLSQELYCSSCHFKSLSLHSKQSEGALQHLCSITANLAALVPHRSACSVNFELSMRASKGPCRFELSERSLHAARENPSCAGTSAEAHLGPGPLGSSVPQLPFKCPRWGSAAGPDPECTELGRSNCRANPA